MTGNSKTSLLQQAIGELDHGRLEQAEGLFRQVLAHDGKNVDALIGMGSIALQVENPEAAYQFLAAALAIDPASGQVHRLIGDFYSVMRNPESAIAHYEKALEIDPSDTDAKASLKAANKIHERRRDPDYSGRAERPWADTDWLWAEQEGFPTLFVLFAGLGIGNAPPTFIFHNFLNAYSQMDKLFVRDLSLSWYLDGMGDLAANVEETADLLRDRISGYEKTVFIGSSSGGMAAILYGELVQPSKVVAFAPQTVLTEAKEKTVGDLRWPTRMSSLRERLGDSKYLDLQNLAPFSATIDIHYARSCEIDRRHAERVTGSHVRYFPHAHAKGHLVALHLRDTGALTRIIQRELGMLPGRMENPEN